MKKGIRNLCFAVSIMAIGVSTFKLVKEKKMKMMRRKEDLAISYGSEDIVSFQDVPSIEKRSYHKVCSISMRKC